MGQETRNKAYAFKKAGISFLIACFLFLVASSVLAAEVSFNAKTQEIKVNQLFEVGVFINTDEESINAFEGKITFPNDLVKVKEIRDWNSIVNFWIDRPHERHGAIDKEQGEIVFSGITPGGFQG